MTARLEHGWKRAASGAAVLAALVPWAVLSCIWGVIFFASLWGTSVKGEEEFAVMFAAVLVVSAVGFCVFAGLALSRRTGLSRGSAIALAVSIAGLWTAAFLAWMISGGPQALPPLPEPLALAVTSGFTVPVAVVGALGLIVESGTRQRARGRHLINAPSR